MSQNPETVKKPESVKKPQSIKVDPWTDFSKQEYSFFKDDFVHEKKLVVKGQAKGARTNISLKETLKNTKSGGYEVADELKCYFSLPNGHSVYGKIKSDDYLKFIFDHGVKQIHGHKWNFYGGMNSKKSLTDISLRFGAHHFSQKCDSDNRIKAQILKGNDVNYYLYSRTMINHNKFTIGLLGVFDLTKHILQKNNVLIGYKHDDKHRVWLRGQVGEFRKVNPDIKQINSIFDTVTLDYIGKINDTTRIGLEASFNTKGEPLKQVQIVGQKKLKENNILLKGKITNKLDVLFSFKKPLKIFEDLATVSATLASFNTLKQKQRKFGYGIQLDLNL